MIKYLTCFKCWGGKAALTYEENRNYKVSCECGCTYTFEHCSLSAAQEYRNKMLELYGEIDKNTKLKAENEQLRAGELHRCKNCAHADEYLAPYVVCCRPDLLSPLNVPENAQCEAWRGLEESTCDT